MNKVIRKISSVLLQTEEQSTNHPEVEIDQIPPDEILTDDPCNGCLDPCGEHKQYPSYLDFDMDSPLLGSMSPYGRHIMIATGQSDWAVRIEEDYGTLAAEIQRILSEKPCETRTFVTNTSMMTNHSDLDKFSDAHDVIIFPDNIIVANVTPSKAQSFIDQFIRIRLPTEPVKVEAYAPLDHFTVHRCPYQSLILICSHKKRDKRCGVTAPILACEFDHVLREKDIDEDEGGTAILMVSHVGGHKFAGNVICYTHQGTRGIWYGRVKSCHCEAIVEQTILGGLVIKDLYRGSMTHSFSHSECPRHVW